jgi:hypothetical protein
MEFIKKIEQKVSASDHFDRIIKEAFGWKDDLALLFSQTMKRPGWYQYFAKLKDKPVAAASMYLNGKFASI